VKFYGIAALARTLERGFSAKPYSGTQIMPEKPTTIGNQPVRLYFSMHTIRRSVHDVRDNEELQIQTGIVNYDNQHIPVWRPKASNKANTRKWMNIYFVYMPQKEGEKYLRYKLAQYSDGTIAAALPAVELSLGLELRSYIDDLRASGKEARHNCIYYNE
jgi:hypothetical protein